MVDKISWFLKGFTGKMGMGLLQMATGFIQKNDTMINMGAAAVIVGLTDKIRNKSWVN